MSSSKSYCPMHHFFMKLNMTRWARWPIHGTRHHLYESVQCWHCVRTLNQFLNRRGAYFNHIPIVGRLMSRYSVWCLGLCRRINTNVLVGITGCSNFEENMFDFITSTDRVAGCDMPLHLQPQCLSRPWDSFALYITAFVFSLVVLNYARKHNPIFI